MARLKTVFHVHTDHSDDSNNSAERLIDLASRAGVGCVAVTDHDTITGAREMASKAGPDLRVIVGEEVSTPHGHLVGLFLREPIERGLSVRQAAQAIKHQGGLVVVPHPFNQMFGCGLRGRINEILDLVDVVEVCNAQNLRSLPNHRAEAFARQFGYPTIVGTDIHHGQTLDACYQWLEPFDGPASFVESLRRATFVKGRHPLGYFVRAAQVILRNKLHLPAPAGFGRHCTQPRPKFQPLPAVYSQRIHTD